MDEPFLKILKVSHVPAQVANWLCEKPIRSTAAFSDLGDDKTKVATLVARVVGLDHTDEFILQPLRTAWRRCDIASRLRMEAQEEGEDLDKDAVMGDEDRAKHDQEVQGHFHFMWPTCIRLHSSILTKLIQAYKERSDYVPKLTEVHSVLETSTDKQTILLQLTKRKELQGVPVDEEAHVQGMWQFKYKHLTVMIGYSQMAGPPYED